MKIMKIFYILIILLLTGCSRELKNQKEVTIEYGTTSSLYSLVDDNIITPDTEIKAEKLGKQMVKYKYRDENGVVNTSLVINVVDTIKPVLQVQSVYYAEVNKKFDLKSKLFFGDNCDRNLKLEFIGTYDTEKEGTYPIKIKVSDESGNITEKETKIVVQKKIGSSNYKPTYYKFENFKNDYKDNMAGIDVSVWQGDIDFEKVKNAGCEFVMIRIGFGHDSKNNIVIDSKFKNNIENAKKAGLLVGIYFYSYAQNVEEAKVQAKWIINELNGIKLDLPIAFDWESWTYFDDYNINFYDINNIAKAFMDECIKNGYDSMLYSSLNYLNLVWDLDNYKTWLAHYTKKTSYDKDYMIWQNSCTGNIDGINGAVDFNIMKR